MRVYLHYEGTGGPAFTLAKVFKEEDETTVAQIIADFVLQYNAAAARCSATTVPLSSNHVQLYHANGQKLSLRAVFQSVVEDRDDVFLKDELSTTQKSTSLSVSTVPESIVPLKNNSSSSNASSNSSNSKARPHAVTANDVETFIKQRNFRKARLLCELSEQDGGLSSHESAWFLARIKLRSDPKKNHNAAERYAAQAIAIGKRIQGMDMTRYSYTLAEAMYAAGDKYEEAEEILSDLLKKMGSKRTTQVLDIRVLKAECLFAMDRHEDAASLLNDHMPWSGAEEHLPTLIAYASFAMKYRKVEEPVRALLKAIVLDQKHKKTKALLAELLSSENGYNELRRQVPPAANAAAAYAFLATAVKECSAMDACIKLLTDALKAEENTTNHTLSTKAASYALNLSHAYEVLYDFDGAFQVLLGFCQRHPKLRVGTTQGYLGNDLYLAMTGKSKAITVAEGVQTASTTSPKFTIPPEHQRETYADHDLDFLAIGFAAVKLCYLQGKFALLPGLYAVCEPTRLASAVALHETPIRNETAYYQCVFQTLDCRRVTPDIHQTLAFKTGSFDSNIPSTSKTLLCDALWSIDYTEKDALTATTTTPASSLSYENRIISPTLLSMATQHPIYVAGDSHCLPPSWSVIYAPVSSLSPPTSPENGDIMIPRLLIPRLVTGVKQWHLRPEGTFYPKMNFQSAMQHIPDGSDVIFLLGEIDCREGLLLAVERDIYPSVMAGMDRVIDIFINDVIKKLVRDRHFRIYIHPIVPVLDITRAIVTEFNRRYREKVEKIVGVSWLDLFDDLLMIPTTQEEEMILAQVVQPVQDPDPSYVPAPLRALRKGLDLDGAHLHPKYVSLIEREMQRILLASST